MIAIAVELHPGGDPVPTMLALVTITNRGPVAPDEGWDRGGERYYEVVDEVTGRRLTIRHFRRDGFAPLVAKALKAVL